VEPPRRIPAEPETFTASTRPPGPPGTVEPRSTIPTVGAEQNRVIDLTEPARPGRFEPPAGTFPVQWFSDDPDASDLESRASSHGSPTGGPNGSANRVSNGARGPAVPAGVPAGRGTSAAAPAPAGAAIPRRVRGAQLPDLGPAAEPVIARPDDGPGAAESLRWQLRSFQLDVQAARRAITETDPVGDRGPATRSTSSGSTAPGQAGRSDHHHGDQAEPIQGHHPEGE
jgi:hypothetical protein